MADIMYTHKDLDGSGCAVIGSLLLDCKVEFHDYKTIDNALTDLFTSGNYENFDTIYITDISPEQGVAELINNIAPDRVKLMDHHETRAFIDNYSWAEYDPKRCGTKIVFDHFSNNGYAKELENFSEFAHLVDTYDRWQSDSDDWGRAQKLNMLHGYLGQKKFIDRSISSENPAKLDEMETTIIDTEIRKLDRYVNSCVKKAQFLEDVDGHKYALTFVERAASQVGNVLCNEFDIDYAVMLNLKYASGEIRSSNGFDVSKVAEKLGGGGHQAAAGFPLETSLFYSLGQSIIDEGLSSDKKNDEEIE